MTSFSASDKEFFKSIYLSFKICLYFGVERRLLDLREIPSLIWSRVKQSLKQSALNKQSYFKRVADVLWRFRNEHPLCSPKVSGEINCKYSCFADLRFVIIEKIFAIWTVWSIWIFIIYMNSYIKIYIDFI